MLLQCTVAAWRWLLTASRLARRRCSSTFGGRPSLPRTRLNSWRFQLFSQNVLTLLSVHILPYNSIPVKPLVIIHSYTVDTTSWHVCSNIVTRGKERGNFWAILAVFAAHLGRPPTPPPERIPYGRGYLLSCAQIKFHRADQKFSSRSDFAPDSPYREAILRSAGSLYAYE